MSSTLIRRANALKEYLTLVAGIPRLSPAQQDALAADLAAGDAEAGLALTESFLPLVVAEAAMRRGLGLRFEALIAAGNRGLARALRRDGGGLQARVLRDVRRALTDALVKAGTTSGR